ARAMTVDQSGHVGRCLLQGVADLDGVHRVRGTVLQRHLAPTAVQGEIVVALARRHVRADLRQAVPWEGWDGSAQGGVEQCRRPNAVASIGVEAEGSSLEDRPGAVVPWRLAGPDTPLDRGPGEVCRSLVSGLD